MRRDTINSRFHRLAFLLRPLLPALLPFAFGYIWFLVGIWLFSNLHLLLRYVARTPADTTSILSPIDGRVVTIESDGDSTQLTLMLIGFR